MMKILIVDDRKYYLRALFSALRAEFGMMMARSLNESIDALFRFLKHPGPFVRAISLERIQKLFGEQFPKEYALGVGTDK